MGERDDARRSIEDARERMSEIAEELARRANPDRLRAVAKEEAMRRGMELRDKAVSRGKDIGERALANPLVVGSVGGVIGSVAGALAAKGYSRSRHSSELGSTGRSSSSGYAYGYAPESEIFVEEGVRIEPRSGEFGSVGTAGVELGESEGPGKGEEVRARISEKSHELRERASSAAGNLKDRASHLRERVSESMPSGEELRGRGREVVTSAERHPGFLVAGGLLLGVAAAMLVPLTSVERRQIRPMRERAIESLRPSSSGPEPRSAGGQPYESPTVH